MDIDDVLDSEPMSPSVNDSIVSEWESTVDVENELEAELYVDCSSENEDEDESNVSLREQLRQWALKNAIDIKANYKNKYKDQTCRLCKKENETQQHVLTECEMTRNNNLTLD